MNKRRSGGKSNNWKFVPDDNQADSLSAGSDDSSSKAVHWTATEYIAHDKSLQWYVILFIVAAVFAGLVYLVTKDKITTAIIIFSAIVLAVYGARKPRLLDYGLDNGQITVGRKTYEYSSFRSFSVVDEGELMSLIFVPLQRFKPLLTIYYHPADERKIMKALDDRLPLDNRGHDVIDNILRWIGY